MRLDELKRSLEISYDFTFKKAFAAIDDWNYGWIDHANLRRFLRSVGYRATKKDLIGILRRYDMDGDAKISMKEF